MTDFKTEQHNRIKIIIKLQFMSFLIVKSGHLCVVIKNAKMMYLSVFFDKMGKFWVVGQRYNFTLYGVSKEKTFRIHCEGTTRSSA